MHSYILANFVNKSPNEYASPEREFYLKVLKTVRTWDRFSITVLKAHITKVIVGSFLNEDEIQKVVEKFVYLATLDGYIQQTDLQGYYVTLKNLGKSRNVTSVEALNSRILKHTSSDKESLQKLVNNGLVSPQYANSLMQVLNTVETLVRNSR